jgi:NAD(P) transhydrogenase
MAWILTQLKWLDPCLELGHVDLAGAKAILGTLGDDLGAIVDPHSGAGGRAGVTASRRGRLARVNGENEEHFDLLVVGAGPAGEKAAAQAAYFGRRVAVVDRAADPGGTMVAGAVSTKTMREAALYLTGFTRHQLYGVGMDLRPEVVIDKLRAREADVTALMTDAVWENLRRHGITYVHGSARLGPDRTLVVTPGDGGPARALSGDAIILATGSRPYRPPGIPFDDSDVLDSDSARVLDRPLRDLVVVGGGAVACEYASIFLALGAQVTLVDRGGRLLPFLDAQLSEILTDTFHSLGMRVLSSTGVVGVRRGEAGGLVVETSSGEHVQAEKVIFAAGRTGNTDDLGLKEAGVAADERGRILVDDHYETSVPGVFAAGDVIGPPALASVSMEQGRVAACFAMDISFKQTVDPLTPSGVYTIPECAMVGLTEEAAQEAGIDYAVGVAWFKDNSRAAIAGATDGALKVLVGRSDRRVLGVHVIGEGATELVHHGQAVIHFGGTIDYFIHSTFDVPTVSDTYKYAAYDCLQHLADG